MESISVAVVGGGHLGQIHTRLLASMPGIELVGIVEPDPQSAARLSDQYGLPVYAQLDRLLSRAEAVVIASPTSTHAALAEQALQAGLHCLVEKPLVPAAAEAERLCELAESHNRVLQVGHVERFNPAWTAARAAVERPTWIDACRCGPYSGRSTDIGVVLDLMIHDLDLILDLYGAPPVTVEASGCTVLGGHEDIAEARLVFANSGVARLYASRVSPTAQRTMQVLSPEAICQLDFSGPQLVHSRRAAGLGHGELRADRLPSQQRLAIKDELFSRWLPTDRPSLEPINAIGAELEDFAQAIRTGGQPRVSGRAAWRAIEVAERILEAIERGQRPPRERERPSILPHPNRDADRKAA
jgi:predicted dehydrogenase